MDLFSEIGKFTLFMKYVLRKPEKAKVFWKTTFREMYLIGIDSLVIVMIIAFFTGAVTTIQTASQLLSPSDLFPTQLMPKFVIGAVVGTSSLLELTYGHMFSISWKNWCKYCL